MPVYFRRNIQGEKHPIVIRSWRDNWQNLSRYFQYTAEIRKLIHTTNTVEGYLRQIRKVTKTKGVFRSDESLLKQMILKRGAETATKPLSNNHL